MALVERLCQVETDPSRNIALQQFCAAMFSILGGYHTIADVKTFYEMTAEDAAEFDTLVARVNATPQLVDKIARAHRVEAILNLWEMRTPGLYDTVDKIRQQLNNV